MPWPKPATACCRKSPAVLTETNRLKTQVVFDARRSGNSTHAENEVVVRGMTVTFAVGFVDADELLEQIIRQHSKPQNLDRRLQRSARSALRYGPQSDRCSSDQWLMKMLDDHRLANKPSKKIAMQSQRCHPKKCKSG